MRTSIIIILLVYSSCVFGQNQHMVADDSVKISDEELLQTMNMLEELNSKGIDRLKDSVIVSGEFNKLLNDKVYRKSIYPNTYTWEKTITYINTKELKKAFWYLINLYPTSDENKELVIRSVITYDALFKMDKVLINTFYTYAFTDPEISIVVNNKPEITRPDILENKLRTVKILMQYIYANREQNNKPK